MLKIIFLATLSATLVNCTGKNEVSSKCGAQDYYKAHWAWLMNTYPTWASSKGWGERHNLFFENTIENINRTHEEEKKQLAKVQKFIKLKACEGEMVNLSLLEYNIKKSIDGHKFESHLIQFESMGGPHTWLPQLHKRVPLKTLQNHKDYLERMSKIPLQFDQSKNLSLIGLKKGITPPQITFKDYESSMLDLAKGEAEDHPFYTPFKKMPDNISAADQKDLKIKAKQIILGSIQPAYKRLHTFWVKQYYPNLRKTISAQDLPQGASFYKFQIKKMTTLDKTAKEIHEIGLSEVKRILAEMETIRKKVKFKGDLQAFFKDLRTNPKFYAKTPEELFNKAAVALKIMDGKMPKLFKVLPRLTYGIEPIPDYIADKSPAAYYNRGDIKIGKAGTYQINLSNLKSRPLYNVVALSLHEAVPGHHLQIALAQEIEGLPEFRKSGGQTAFVEGWGLYSESLGKMVGMYDDPYDDFGRLTYEQWRAMRLVVDTGIHAFGWSRDKAINYMKSNSGLSEKNIITEVDRYINWPGQALAYKIGELKIKELRAKAEAELGDKYDIRDFHDEVLKEGAVPLPVLENNINTYITRLKK